MRITRSEVSQYSNYHQYREYLRKDFLYSCAYCSISEMEARGISFEIEHYWEQEYFPELKCCYTNLMWSCKRCNNGGKKLKFKRTKSLATTIPRFIKIDVDDTLDHFKRKSDRLEHLTLVGAFTIDLLDLNSTALRGVRKERQEKADDEHVIIDGLKVLSKISIDKLKPAQRARFIGIRKKLLQKCQKLNDEFESLLKSQLVDIPEASVRQKQNRELHKKWDPLFDSTDAPLKKFP